MKFLLWFMMRLALVVALAVWLIEQPGHAEITWRDYIFETSAAALALGALATGFVFYLMFRVFHFIAHGPTYWRLSRRIKRHQQGQHHLTQGLMAVAKGDAAEAGRCAISARRALGKTTLSELLQAQAAQMVGDLATAKQIFYQLASDSSSDVIGYRGLIMLARRQRDTVEVERLIDKLYQQKPETPWLCLMRFDVLVQQHRWNDANIMLAQVATAQLQDPDHIRRQRAALLVASSQQAAAKGWTNDALQLAERAMKQIPNWLPAIINLAQRQSDAGHKRAARRTVERHWANFPHPDLAESYTGKETALEAYKFIDKLCRRAGSVTVNVALSKAAVAAELWGEARRHLTQLVATQEAARGAYRLLAELERRERGDETAATRWMIEAVDAPADPTWLCADCSGSHDGWQASCHHCNAFNTIDWRRPGLSLTLPVFASAKKLNIEQIAWQETILP